jgi:hypothetical protein
MNDDLLRMFPDGDLLRTLPDHVLTTQVFTYFGFKDYALTSCASHYSQAHWQNANEQTPLPLYVPEDCRTLNEAVQRVEQDPRITTIALGRGEHQVDGEYLEIFCAMRIVGRPGVPKEEIVVLSGIKFVKGIHGNCHLQHMTLRQAPRNGVYGQSSFTMDDVLVEQGGFHGVSAVGNGVVGKCTNLEVRQCEYSGLYALDGGSITLIGAKTTVHHNCTHGEIDTYGLAVHGSSSTVQLLFPLTKEQVSIDNGGGVNWGVDGFDVDINQIITIHEAELAVQDAALAAKASRIGAASQNIKATGTVNVPEDCHLYEIVKAVQFVHAEDRRQRFRGARTITIIVGKGEHQITNNEFRDDSFRDEDGVNDDELKITSAMNIVGDPGVAKEEIVVVGGIYFMEGIQENCHLQHLTLRQAKGNGVTGHSSFTMEDVLVEQCGRHGVMASGTGVTGKCTNMEVRQCGASGVFAGTGGSMTLIGAKTTVHHNCTAEYRPYFGLQVYGSSSTIQLISPLTKEQISIDNNGGGNWGAEHGGDINQIKTMTTAEFTAVLEEETMRDSRIEAASQKMKTTGTVNVPEDCDLYEAVEAKKYLTDGRSVTIFLGKGKHQVVGDELGITSAMNIVGDPGVAKEEIVVVGGIKFERGIQENCHLQHLTLRQANGNGVTGNSSFTMEDVLVEQCDGHGVYAVGQGNVGQCTNVEVRQCGRSGVFAQCSASITLIGAKTMVHHNCTRECKGDYGLAAYNSPSSTIQLVSPLTKEQVSIDNSGGGNWGADGGGADINQIKTIDAPTISSSSSAAVAEAPVGETKSSH